jgi:hypothetical protein
MRDDDRELVRDLLSAHHEEVAPAGSEERIWRALADRLHAPLPPPAQDALSPDSKAAWGASAWAITGSLAIVAAVVALSWPQRPAIEGQAAAPAPSPQTEPLADAPPPAKAPPPSLALLEQETRLLGEAQRALTDSQPQRALTALDEHGVRFPDGRLAQERDALRVVAMCRLGQHERAQSERTKLEQRWPGSPLLLRVRAVCERPL